jgi:CHASE2 domain-containing sensor protein
MIKPKISRTKSLWVTAAVVYVFCVLLACLISSWEEKAESYNPIHIFFRDFDITDLYYQPRDTTKKTITLDGDITIINTLCASRGDLVRTIKCLNHYSTTVIGIDYNFVKVRRTQQDSSETRALDSLFCENPNLVTGYILPKDTTRKPVRDFIPFSQEPQGRSLSGFTNLSDSVSTVRTVRLMEKRAGQFYRSFALAVCDRSNQEYDLLNDTQKFYEEFRIKYVPADHFKTISMDSLLAHPVNYAAWIRGHIVLLGDSDRNDAGCGSPDKHFTPMNPQVAGRSFPDLEGVYIHANVIRSLMKQGSSIPVS